MKINCSRQGGQLLRIDREAKHVVQHVIYSLERNKIVTQ
jgi:hypothetical protein